MPRLGGGSSLRLGRLLDTSPPLPKDGGVLRFALPEGREIPQKGEVGDFPGSPVVKIPCSQFRGHGFHPRLGD